MLPAPKPMLALPPGFAPSPLLPLIRDLLYYRELKRAIDKIESMRLWP